MLPHRSLLLQWLRALACGLLLCALSARGAPADPFQWDGHIVRGQLDNGLQYHLVKVPRAHKQVGMHLIVRTGSLDERDDQSGVAHMVEHMVFHATTGHPQGLHAYLKQRGLTVGRHYNAQTNFERTQFMLALDSRPERWQVGLEALGEIAGGALIPAQGLERERPVILEEWRMKLGVRERMEAQRRALLREGSLYPQRPTIGTEHSIRTQSAGALRAFHAAWYRPNNMALLVVGDIDPQALVPMIQARFKGLQAAALPARNPADPVLGRQLRIARMQDAESGSSQVGWVFRFHGDDRQDSEGLRSRLIDRLAERLVRQAVRQQAVALPPLVESLTSSKGDLGGSVESLGFASSVALHGHREGLQQILLAQARLMREPIDGAALAREIDEIRRLNARGVSSRDERDLAGWLQSLSEVVTAGRVLQDARQKQQQVEAIVPTLSAQAVHERIRHWLSSPDQLLFMVAPGLSPLTLPSHDEVASMQARIAAAPLPVRAQAVAAPASVPETVVELPAAQTTGSIVEEVRELGDEVVRWRLSNGDQFIWLRSTDKDMRFAMRSGAGHGLSGAPAWEWQVAAQLARDGELQGLPDGALASWLKARQLSLTPGQTATQLSHDAQFKPGQLEDLLRLAAARQTLTRIPAEGLQRVVRQLQRQDARQPDSVNARLNRAMSTLRHGAQPSGQQPTAADLQALQGEAGLHRIQARWQQLAARPTTYFLMGDVAPERLRALVEQHLAGIERQAGPPAQALLQKPGRRERTLAIGIEPQGSVRAIGSQAMAWTPEGAIGSAVLSQVIHRALRTELREKESGIYRLSFSLSLDAHTDRLHSELSYTADPARLEALWARTREVLAALPEHIDEAVLVQEARRMQQQEQARQADPATRFARLQLSVQQWGDARYLGRSGVLGASLTPERLRALLDQVDLMRDLCSVLLLPRERSR